MRRSTTQNDRGLSSKRTYLAPPWAGRSTRTGSRDLLLRFNNDYDLPAVYISESGVAFEDELVEGRVHDRDRREYLERHFTAAAEATAAGVPLPRVSNLVSDGQLRVGARIWTTIRPGSRRLRYAEAGGQGQRPLVRFCDRGQKADGLGVLSPWGAEDGLCDRLRPFAVGCMSTLVQVTNRCRSAEFEAVFYYTGCEQRVISSPQNRERCGDRCGGWKQRAIPTAARYQLSMPRITPRLVHWVR